jgi:hypothetical protein
MLWLHDYLITDINTWFELLNMWSCQHKKGSELNKCKDHQTSIQTVKNCGKKCIHTMLDGKNSKMIVGMCLYIHVCFSSTIKQQLLTSRRQKKHDLCVHIHILFYHFYEPSTPSSELLTPSCASGKRMSIQRLDLTQKCLFNINK